MTNLAADLFRTVGIPLQNFRKESEKNLGFNPLSLLTLGPLIAVGVIVYLLIKK